MTTWNKELAVAIGCDPAGLDAVVIAKAPADETVWNQEFDSGYGGNDGAPVLAWTSTRVYFPVNYDGAEWLDSAPRNPQPEGQYHVGGG